MKKTLFFFAISMFLFSCSSKDKSPDAEIIDLSVSVLSGDLSIEDTYIDSENDKVYIFIDNDLTNQTFPLSFSADLQLSSGAKTSSIMNGEISFTNPDEVKTIVVEAEDGTLKDWHAYLIHHQIQNSDFENWFTNVGMNGVDYNEIGKSAVESLWATANMGTSIYSVYGTQPITENTNKQVQLTTGKTTAVPITAATLFTGRFNIAGAISNPTDPKKATIFGIPFRFRPTGIKIKYKFQAGERYIQATLNNPTNIFGGFTITDIDGEDQCSIFAILEIRNGDQVTEIARADFESGTTGDVLTETTIPFTYTSTQNPTHITIVFSSSTDGDLWRGAVGSTLVVDDFELVYK